MPRSLHKVQKYVAKKRGGKPTISLHENSRDAQRLRRAGAREEKLSRIFHAATKSNQNYVERTAWFQSAIHGSTGPISAEELHLLTSNFISRDGEELETLEAQRRAGRPPSSREDQLRQRFDSEMREFRAGFWIPDLRDEEGRSKLERWSGDWAGMNSLKFVRIVEGGTITNSSFPPERTVIGLQRGFVATHLHDIFGIFLQPNLRLEPGWYHFPVLSEPAMCRPTSSRLRDLDAKDPVSDASRHAMAQQIVLVSN